MNIFKLIFVSFFSILLVACSTQQVTPPPAPQTGVSVEQRECIARCLDMRKRCLTQKNKLVNQCSVNEQRNARLAYEAYVLAQTKADKKITRTKQSFLNLRTCHKASPQCGPNYKQCCSVCTK